MLSVGQRALRYHASTPKPGKGPSYTQIRARRFKVGCVPILHKGTGAHERDSCPWLSDCGGSAGVTFPAPGRKLPTDHGDLRPASGLPGGGGRMLGPRGGRGQAWDKGHVLVPLTTPCFQLQDSQVCPGEQAEQDSWRPASFEASWPPGGKTPRPSSLQGPHFEDVMTSRSSDWLQQLDGAPVCQLDGQPSWDPEPRFWQDVLTEQLWQMFACAHDRVDQPRHRSECPRGERGGLRPRRGTARAELVILRLPFLLPLS